MIADLNDSSQRVPSDTGGKQHDANKDLKKEDDWDSYFDESLGTRKEVNKEQQEENLSFPNSKVNVDVLKGWLNKTDDSKKETKDEKTVIQSVKDSTEQINKVNALEISPQAASPDGKAVGGVVFTEPLVTKDSENLINKEGVGGDEVGQKSIESAVVNQSDFPNFTIKLDDLKTKVGGAGRLVDEIGTTVESNLRKLRFKMNDQNRRELSELIKETNSWVESAGSVNSEGEWENKERISEINTGLDNTIARINKLVQRIYNNAKASAGQTQAVGSTKLATGTGEVSREIPGRDVFQAGTVKRISDISTQQNEILVEHKQSPISDFATTETKDPIKKTILSDTNQTEDGDEIMEQILSNEAEKIFTQSFFDKLNTFGQKTGPPGVTWAVLKGLKANEIGQKVTSKTLKDEAAALGVSTVDLEKLESYIERAIAEGGDAPNPEETVEEYMKRVIKAGHRIKK